MTQESMEKILLEMLRIQKQMLENQIKMSENIDQIYQMCLGLYGGVTVQRSNSF